MKVALCSRLILKGVIFLGGLLILVSGSNRVLAMESKKAEAPIVDTLDQMDVKTVNMINETEKTIKEVANSSESATQDVKDALESKESTPQEVGNKFCPIEGGPIEEGQAFKFEYNSKIYNLCCAACEDAFKKDPGAAIKKIEEMMKSEEATEVIEQELTN